jgi:hypothetical protein
MAGPQIQVGPIRVRRCHGTLRPKRAHLATRHRAVQQVRIITKAITHD